MGNESKLIWFWVSVLRDKPHKNWYHLCKWNLTKSDRFRNRNSEPWKRWDQFCNENPWKNWDRLLFAGNTKSEKKWKPVFDSKPVIFKPVLTFFYFRTFRILIPRPKIEFPFSIVPCRYELCRTETPCSLIFSPGHKFGPHGTLFFRDKADIHEIIRYFINDTFHQTFYTCGFIVVKNHFDSARHRPTSDGTFFFYYPTINNSMD